MDIYNAQVRLLEDGADVWTGGLLEFAHDNDLHAGTLFAQLTTPEPECGRLEPVMFGGGAAPEFMLLLLDEARDGQAA